MDTAGAVNISNYVGPGPEGNGTWRGLGSGSNSTYIVSEQHNQFVVTGCNVQGTLLGDSGNIITGPRNGTATCSGIGCCETAIPIGRPSYSVQFKYLDPNHKNDGKLPMAVRIAERGWFDSVATHMLNNTAGNSVLQTAVPVVLEWAVASTRIVSPGMTFPDGGSGGNLSCPIDAARSSCRSSHSTCHNVIDNYRTGYVCQCRDGYDGNPYLPGDGGCQDINECALPGKCFSVCTNTAGSYQCRCPRGARGNPYMADGCVKSSLGLSVGLGVGSGAGLLVLVLGVVFVTRRIKHQRARMLKQKFFKQNRGHLLQQLVSQNVDIAQRMIIPLVELEKATNNFDKTRELGGGGHGTVYKGILSDLHVVAIKKSKVAIQREIDEFINEVAILSQINHRNLVRLFGCCLETEVPLLVYEFISNGTLYDHLHVEGPKSLSWEHRLKIATETARALSYLHMAVSFPIVHRDVKSHNILLDGSLTAKVSDFGASRSIPPDQTGVTTAIQGTLGYLDPMYYYTGRLTEKSDVYSFGVVLNELLTRKKPYSYRSPENDSLIAQFTSLLTQGNLSHVLDPQVMEEGGKEVSKVAALATICVKLKAEERPTMRDRRR
ncbi:wall-associated receptor kinase 2-like [Panicum miliaceum]|uniref:Wall-associated receptor kinase 2-like n=1 Tax=Panicum miliaceum TaxID=4540 RepID=A0A3L6SKT1_PANMI|nr:wall-associated receptor kinase 2-like [Panicum miliaceum]